MKRFKVVIIVCFIIVLSSLSANLIVYWADNKEYNRINDFVEHCTTPVQYEFKYGVYRYYCDAGYYNSSLLPEKYQKLKDKK